MKISFTRQAKSRPVARSRRDALALLPSALNVALNVALLVVLIVAPSFSATASPQTSTVEALGKLRDAWVQDLRTKQLEPILNFYAPDAAFLQPDGERLTGSATLRTLFQTIMASFNSDLELHSQKL